VVQLVRLVADNDRVSGIRPALITDDDLKPRCQQIDEFSLRLISPLQPNHTSSRHDHILQTVQAATPRPSEPPGLSRHNLSALGRRLAYRPPASSRRARRVRRSRQTTYRRHAPAMTTSGWSPWIAPFRGILPNTQDTPATGEQDWLSEQERSLLARQPASSVR
jgi:hypothetical protein